MTRVFRRAASTRRTRPLGDSATRIMLAILDGEWNMTEIARRLGLSTSTVWLHTRRLRDHGLLDYEDGKHGTIHPKVGFVTDIQGTMWP